jgi:hypothetical protein
LEYRIHTTNQSIPSATNWSVIKNINLSIYRTLLTRLGVKYNDDELHVHLNLGFRHKTALSNAEVDEYLNWLRKLAKANEKSGYFHKESFLNTLLTQVIYVYKIMRRSAANYSKVVAALKDIYSVKSFAKLLQLKLKRRLAVNNAYK